MLNPRDTALWEQCAAHAESARLRQEIVDSQSGLEEDIRRLNDSIGERMELVFLRDAENDRCRELQRKSRDLREYSTQLLEAQARAKVDAARVSQGDALHRPISVAMVTLRGG